jgi:hypothetical protein
MSDERTAAPERRESIGGVLGVSFGLLLLALLVVSVLRFGSVGGHFDGQEGVAELFRDGRLPAGFELVESAKLQTGDVVYRLRRPLEEEEAEAVPPQDEEAEEVPPEEEEAEETPPDEILLVEYARASAAAAAFRPEDEVGGEAREAREASSKLIEWRKSPTFSWFTPLRGGQISWGAWNADYAVHRAFHEGGSWREAARVNLSQPGRNLLLFALWPEKVLSKDEELEKILERVALLED